MYWFDDFPFSDGMKATMRNSIDAIPPEQTERRAMIIEVQQEIWKKHAGDICYLDWLSKRPKAVIV